MRKSKIKELINEIIHDESKNIEERIDEVLDIRTEHMSDDEAKQKADDVEYFTSLIAMTLESNGPGCNV